MYELLVLANPLEEILETTTNLALSFNEKYKDLPAVKDLEKLDSIRFRKISLEIGVACFLKPFQVGI